MYELNHPTIFVSLADGTVSSINLNGKLNQDVYKITSKDIVQSLWTPYSN